MNIDVADGLTKGVMGAVTEIITGTSPLGLPEAICVLFQEERVGFNSRSRLRPPSHVHSSSTVIRPQTETIQTKPFQITRHQYPFMLAWAVTCHKIQGATTSTAVVSLEGAFQPGMSYVALSRVTSSSGLHLLEDHFNLDAIYCDPSIQNKLSHMPEANTLPGWNSLEPDQGFDHTNHMYIASHNCEGLLPHLQEFTSNLFLQHMDIIALQETWMNQNSTFRNPLQTYNVELQCRDYNNNHLNTLDTNQSTVKGGVAFFIHQDFAYERIPTDACGIDCVAVKLLAKQLSVYSVYKPPSLPINLFLQKLTLVLENSPTENCIVLGDFNIDLIQYLEHPLTHTMLRHRFKQIINKATTAHNTLIDHIYQRGLIVKTSGVIPTHYSYHDLTYIEI